jgi:hypothetical protein
MPRIIREYNINGNGTYLIDKFTDQLGLNQPTLNGVWVGTNDYVPLPTGIDTFDTNPLQPYLGGIKIVPEDIPSGQTIISINDISVAGITDEFLVIINLLPDYVNGLPNYDNECCSAINIIWVNREGGYENYIFTGRRQVYEVEPGEEEAYKTRGLVRKNSQIKDVYRAVICGTQEIPANHLIKLESLRNSIQAWLYDDSLPAYANWNDRFIPIVIDRETFITRDTREKVIQRNIRFLIGQEVIIQTQ